MESASGVVLAAVEGCSITPIEAAFFNKNSLAGVTLFKRNVPSPYADLLKLCQDIQGTARDGEPSKIIAIDQEGGRVRRIQDPFPDKVSAYELAEGQFDEASLSFIRQHAKATSRELLELGININFAPVADTWTEPTNTAIGDRCFGKTVESTAIRADAFLNGMLDAGLGACLKHFPGQGHAQADTHEKACEIDLSKAQLHSRELMPFKKLLPNADMVMMSHCIYPTWSPKAASVSSEIIRGVLQEELGFKGLVVSDDMVMHAIPQDQKSWAKALIDAIHAGVDLLLVCRGIDKIQFAVEALTAEAKRSTAFKNELDRAYNKVLSYRKTVI